MAQMVSWPAVTNDDGSLTTGTIVNEAWEQAVKASIEDQVHNTTYTTVKPKDITGEVEAIKVAKAAGSWSNLKDALDGVVDFSDGSLIIPAGVIDTDALKAAIGGKNLAMNSDFTMWPEAAAPAYWYKESGTNALRDSATKKIGLASCKLTRSGVDTTYYYDLVDDVAGLMGGYFRGEKVSFSCWVKTSTAASGRVILSDGIGGVTKTHSGSGDWELLYGVHTMNVLSTKLQFRIAVVNNDAVAHFDGLTIWLSGEAPDRWIPNEVQYGTVVLGFPGALATGDGQGTFRFARPAMVKDVIAQKGVPHDGGTAPSGGVITIDVEKWDSAAWQSVFSAPKDIVADGQNQGGASPDTGTYYNRCLLGVVGGNTANALLQLNLDAVNGAKGFWFGIRCIQFINPLENFLAFSDVR